MHFQAAHAGRNWCDYGTGRTALCPVSTELRHWPRPHAAGVYSHAYGIRAVAPSTARMLAHTCISPMLASSILPLTVSASALSMGVARQSVAVHVAIWRCATQCTRDLPHATCDRRHAACNRRLGRNPWLSRPIIMAAPRWLWQAERVRKAAADEAARLVRRHSRRESLLPVVRANARHNATQKKPSAARHARHSRSTPQTAWRWPVDVGPPHRRLSA
jgi:hypothetical protein